MGITSVGVTLANPADPSRTVDVDLLVDSGAIFSVVPAPVLRRIGVVPRGRETFTLASGGRIRRDVGDVMHTIAGRRGAAPVVFGRRSDAGLLGVVSLEALGLRLDPLRRQLRPLRLMIA